MRPRTFLPLALILALAVTPAIGASRADDLGARATIVELTRRLAPEVLAPSAARALDAAAPSDRLEVIVQMRDTEVADAHLQMLRSYGLTPLVRFAIIPAVAASGTPAQIRALASDPRVFRIEHNAPIRFHLDRSTSTIGADKVWERFVHDEDGISLPVDGRGVTIAIVDSGVDATHPDLRMGTKTVKNIMFVGAGSRGRADEPHGEVPTAAGLFVDVDNSDTTSGHGTHVAGIAAGLGSMSGNDARSIQPGGPEAASRRGVAHGAKILGIGVGEGRNILAAMAALDWIYRHIRDEGNALNIRVINNSWGGDPGEWNPSDSITQAVLVLGNDMDAYVPTGNQNIVFAAGNDGPGDATTGPYDRIPVVVSVANAARTGLSISNSSSRGASGQPWTYPDVAAPGSGINSTVPTVGALIPGPWQARPYGAASGTSMAAPHVAGAIALMLQANPDLDLAGVRDDAGPDAPRFYTFDFYNQMTEAEWILKATARRVGGTRAGMSDNGYLDGVHNGPDDGYGLIDVERAVATSFALRELRKTDPSATVADAVAIADQLIVDTWETNPNADELVATWYGTSASLGTPVVADDAQYAVTVPSSWSSLTLTLRWAGLADLGIRIAAITGDGGSVSCTLTQSRIASDPGSKSVRVDDTSCPGIEDAVTGDPQKPWQIAVVPNGFPLLADWEMHAYLTHDGDVTIGRPGGAGGWYPAENGDAHADPGAGPSQTVLMRSYDLARASGPGSAHAWLHGPDVKADPAALLDDAIGRVLPSSLVPVEAWLAWYQGAVTRAPA